VKEEWRSVSGYEGYYEVSSRGRVRGIGRRLNDGRWWKGRIRSTPPNPHGYPCVSLHRKNKLVMATVHRLVATAFYGPRPTGFQADHINFDRTDNRVENLEWVTPGENNRRAHQKPGRRPTGLSGERNPASKLTEVEVVAIRKRRADGELLKYLAFDYSVDITLVGRICLNKAWKHVR
jgi:hypothetical protein